MNENIGFSISGYSVFIALLAAIVFIISQAATANIEIVTVVIFILTVVAVPGFYGAT
ncbi:MAG: hypothetical protein ACI9HU_001600 [Colwellia sp.]|jgi:hypothetical protein